MKAFIFILITGLFFGCVPKDSSIAVNFNKKNNSVSQILSANVSSVQIVNNQLVITGNGLAAVTNVKVDGTAFTENFSIESKSATQIIANSIRAFSFDVSKVFNVILSDANASATFPIDFSLCNATLNGKGFSCATAVADKDVLSYDAVSGTWKPRAVSGLNYLGAFNASANPPAGPATQPAGAYYIISASGTIAGIPFITGDWLVSNGSSWQKIDNSTAVLSVFGRSGSVTAQSGDYNLDMLGDISFPVAPVAGKVLKFDGTNWVAGDDISGGGAGSVTTTEILDGAVTDAKITTLATSKLTGTISSAQITDGTITNADINATANITATKLGTGAIDNTEFNYLDGVTSLIQTQINGKQASDATLTSLSAYNTNGILVQTAADSFTGRTIAGTVNRVTVANGNGVAGDPTLNISSTLLPSPVAGDVGKFLMATAADTSVWTTLNLVSTDVTTALGFTPINKAGDSITAGDFIFSGASALRAADPIAPTDVVNRQYLESFGQWTKNGSDIYRSGGNVGIGTNTPSKKLEVVGDSLIAGIIFKSGQNDYDNTASVYPIISRSTTGGGGIYPFSNSGNLVMAPRADGSSDIVFATGVTTPTTKMVIKAGGNVGIGTTTPQSKLDVNGAVRLGADGAGCTAANAGAMKFNNPNIEFCNGLAWNSFGVSNAPVASTQITDGTIADADVNAAANITATKLGTGAVDNTEFNHLNGVTSSIQTQLDSKEASLPTGGTAAQYFAGNKTLQTLNTLAVPELTNLYFTQARAIASPLTGVTSTAGTITASDTIVGAFGKLLNTQTDYVSKTGNSTITGTMTINSIVGALKVPGPVNPDDAVPKSYVDGFGQWGTASGNVYRSGGAVGLGTTTPDRRLTIVGDGTDYGDDIFIEAVNSEVAIPQISLTRSRGTTAARTPALANDKLGILAFRGNEINGLGTFPYASKIYSQAETDFQTEINGNLVFETNNAGTIAEKMRITSKGKLGVGVTAPTAKVSIGQNSVSSAGITLTAVNAAKTFSTSAAITLMAGDYLIPTTTTGQARAVLVGGTGTSFTVSPPFSGAVTGETFTIYPAGLNVYNNVYVQGSTGFLGVGTSTPERALHIVGTGGGEDDIYITSNSNSGNTGTISMARSRGTFGSETAIGVNDLMAEINSRGHNGTAYEIVSGINMHSETNFATSSSGDLRFITKATGVARSEKLRITGAGFVGINNPAPTVALDVKGQAIISGGSNSLHLKAGPTDDHVYLSFFSRSASPSLRTAFIGIPNAGSNDLNLYNEMATGILSFGTNDTERVRIDATGNLGINTVVPDAKLMVNSGTTIGRYTATGWLHSSDARLKHDINTITNATEKILKLRGVDYILNNDPTNERQLGFIAQEVEPLFPEVVRTDKTGFKSMVYANLVAPLVEAFKDLYKKVTDIFITTDKNTRAIASVNLKIKKLEEENTAKSKEIAELKSYLCSKDPHAPVCK